jgi:hypothetical protein
MREGNRVPIADILFRTTTVLSARDCECPKESCTGLFHRRISPWNITTISSNWT